MRPKPFFSVIIPTYHRNSLLAKCLGCLAPGRQMLAPEQYEVIVTDDGSQTTAAQMVREHYPWAQWVSGPRTGNGANRNNGAKYAKGEWLAFTDDDCLPDPQWLKAYSEAIAANPASLVFEGRTYVDRPKCSLAEKSPVNETGGYLWSCNFAIRQDLFESLAGFDERYRYSFADVDLGFRLRKLKYEFPFIKAASVCHPWRLQSGSQDGWKKPKIYRESIFTYLSLHPTELKRLNTPYYLKQTLRRLVRETIPGIIKFRGRGIKEALLDHIEALKMAFLIQNFRKRINMMASKLDDN